MDSDFMHENENSFWNSAVFYHCEIQYSQEVCLAGPWIMLHHISCLKLLAYYHLKTKYENQQTAKTEKKIVESW